MLEVVGQSRDGATLPVQGGERYVFEIYLSVGSPISEQALSNLKALCCELGESQCCLEIVDVSKDPERAEKERVLAIPTLIKRAPGPALRVLGDLEDRRKLLRALRSLAPLHELRGASSTLASGWMQDPPR